MQFVGSLFSIYLGPSMTLLEFNLYFDTEDKIAIIWHSILLIEQLW